MMVNVTAQDFSTSELVAALAERGITVLSLVRKGDANAEQKSAVEKALLKVNEAVMELHTASVEGAKKREEELAALTKSVEEELARACGAVRSRAFNECAALLRKSASNANTVAGEALKHAANAIERLALSALSDVP